MPSLSHKGIFHTHPASIAVQLVTHSISLSLSIYGITPATALSFNSVSWNDMNGTFNVCSSNNDLNPVQSINKSAVSSPLFSVTIVSMCPVASNVALNTLSKICVMPAGKHKWSRR